MSATGIAKVPVTPAPSRSSTPPPKRNAPVCPGAPGRVKPADVQPVSGSVGRDLGLGNVSVLMSGMRLSD